MHALSNSRLFLFFIVAAIALPSTLQGATLFEKQVSITRTENTFASDEFDLDLPLGDDPFFVTNAATLFDALTITPSNVGDTYIANLASEPLAFPTAADRLTDGLNGQIGFIATETSQNIPQGTGFPENTFFSQPAATPDLAGAIVEEVRLRLDQFTFETSPPQGQPGFEIVLTFTAIGRQVPEPASLAAGIVGALCMAPHRRRRYR